MKIEICIGTTCHLMGGSYMEDMISKYSAESDVNLKFVTCFDVCNGEIPAPVVRVDGELHGDMSYEKLDTMICKFLIEKKSGEK